MAEPERKLYKVTERQHFGGIQYGPGEYMLEAHQAAGLNAVPVTEDKAKAAEKKANGESLPFTEEEIAAIKALKGELGADFPGKAAFNKAGITKVEEVTGRPEAELLKIAGITKPVLAQVQDKLRALAAEPAKPQA